jgi:hypothetical protein
MIPADYEFPTELPKNVQFLKWKEEICPKTNNVHYQCYIHFSNAAKGTAINTALGVPEKSLKWYKCGGTEQENINYIDKERTTAPGGKVGELGVAAHGQGKSHKLEEAVDILRRTRSLAEVAEQMPVTFIQHHRGLERFLQITTHARARAPTVYVYWGTTGTGKTHEAIEKFKALGIDYYVKSPNTKWFDGINGHKGLLIDEFNGGAPIEDVLRWLDKYECGVEVKGGSAQLTATTIIITSNIEPRDWYPGARAHQIDALLRRFTGGITQFTKRNGEVVRDQEPVIKEEPWEERNAKKQRVEVDLSVSDDE